LSPTAGRQAIATDRQTIDNSGTLEWMPLVVSNKGDTGQLVN